MNKFTYIKKISNQHIKNDFMQKFFVAVAVFLTCTTNSLFAVTISDDTVSGVDRYAVYVGCNYGGKSRERLLYAGSDAQSFKNTMAEIGGVTDTNSRILLDPTKDNIDTALDEISNAITQNGNKSKRSEFIFYYSGHSDENALLLGDAKYEYSKLKASISAVPSDIHVVILDSCYSGNFIRTKGGQKRKPFLIDDSSVVTGHAYLSSSSDNESSQESDEIESSYFTNAMITGLRGAADTSGDNKVTLNELYSYAFNDTLSKTESSKAGPQHPNYNITLVGSGDLVLSDLSTAESMLSLSKDAKGKFIIRDSNDKLISEINKIQGQPIFMALPSGQYSALIIDEYSTKQGIFVLEKDQIYVLDQNSLSSIKRKTNRLRGDSDNNNENSKVEKLSKSEKIGEYLTLDDLEDTKESKNTTLLDDDDDFEDFDDEDGEFLDNDIIANENSENNESGKIAADFEYGEFIPFDLQIIPGIHILGGEAQNTLFSWGLIGSSVYNVKALQYSQVFNIACGDVFGFQVASVFNTAAGKVSGFQVSSVFNIASKDLFGGQISGVFNTSSIMTGTQVTGVWNSSKEILGSQISGVANFSEKNNGTQVAGVLNITRDIKGSQISGCLNFADTVKGIQVSGCLNSARQINGFQIGVINVAEKSTGATIGLINYVGNGLRDVCIGIDTDECIDLFYQGGAKFLFTTLGFTKVSEDYFEGTTYGSIYSGLGTEFAFKKCSLDLELFWKFVYSDREDVKYDSSENLITAKRISKQLASISVPSFKVTFNFLEGKYMRLFAATSFDINVRGWNDLAFELYKKSWVTSEDSWKVSPVFSFGAKLKI